MKQQQLTFEKGMTNVPSDAICSDNALEYAEGMIFRDGEHHVIQKPKENSSLNSADKTLVFVHKLGNGTENYIYDNGTNLYYKGTNYTAIKTHTGQSLKSITAIGKTLIASFGGTLYYGLFKDGGYTDITDIPTPNVEFRMGMDSVTDPDHYQDGYSVVFSEGSPNGIIGYNGPRATPTYFYIKTDENGSQENYNNLVVGVYSKNLKDIKEKMGFAEPFCARVALELYDGSYTSISNPIMLLPAVTKNSSAYNEHGVFRIYTNYSLLYCKLNNDYSNYNDIIKDVVVFITDGVKIYDTTVDQPANDEKKLYEAGNYDILTNCVAFSTTSQISKLTTTTKPNDERRWMVLKERPKKEIEDDLVRQTIYYRLCSLGTASMNNYEGVADKIKVHTLETLTTQERLEYDDFYSHCPLKADFLYAYNNRLNAAGVKRGFFGGFDFFIADDIVGNAAYYTALVTIKTPEGEKVISHTTPNVTKHKHGIWFYYPDPRASHVYIQRGSSCVCDADLTEHPNLNGAYYFKGLLEDETVLTNPGSAPSVTHSQQEDLGNYLLTSEVNNPFVFRASGYNRVGDGDIVGMAAQTQALSQGQFGQYPLNVFTTEGIWALSLDRTGQFVASHPMSREVALKSNPAITPVDGAIFFVSKKGLMLIDGSKVVCVSEQMKGKTGTLASAMGNFVDFLSTAFIAYDYRDSLLWIFDGHYTSSTFTGSRYCYIYSIKSGTFAVYDFGSSNIIKAAVNDYPDYLIQDKGASGKVYTLYSRDDVNADAASANRYNGSLKSRPMKLENALALKRIIQIKHIRNMDATYTTTSGTPAVETTHPTLVFSMYGSNDAVHWCALTSVRSVPWKYYRFEYAFDHLKATDTFSGTVVVTEEVRTNKLR